MSQNISVRYHQQKLSLGLSISTTSYWDHQFPKHFHDHYTIQLIEQGVNEGFTESNKYKVSKGGLLVINPGELHAGNSLNSNFLKFHTIRLSLNFIQTFYEQNDIYFSEDLYFSNHPIYNSVTSRQVYSIIKSMKYNNEIAFESDLTELLMSLAQVQMKPINQAIASLEKAREFLHGHYTENLTLKQIAEVCHLSPFHFLRQFKKQFGMTPLQYLSNIRIEKAKTLLGQHSISQTAHQVGFYDHSHFLRHYKKIEGATPSLQIKKIN